MISCILKFKKLLNNHKKRSLNTANILSSHLSLALYQFIFLQLSVVFSYMLGNSSKKKISYRILPFKR